MSSARTFAVERDARVGTNGSTNLGAGACDHLCVGEDGGYHYRSFIKFDHDWSGMADVSGVRLYLTNTDEYHLSRGSASTDRKFYVDRVTEGWSAGTASHPMTTSNGSISSGGDMVYPGPTCSTSGNNRAGPFTASDVDNDQDSWNVTDLFQLFGPSTVYFSGATTPGYGLGYDNYGIRLIREDSADVVEFWSSEKGGASYVPKIVVTYTSNALPVTVIDSPSSGTVFDGGTTYATPSITVGCTATDSDGDSITNVQIQIAASSSFASTLVDDTADDDTAGVVSRVISDAALTRGAVLYVRARAHDGTSWGAWSLTSSFTINNALSPAITGTAGTVMEMTVEGTDTTAKAVVRFSYLDPEGDSISRYICKLQDSTGVTTYETIDENVTAVPSYVKFDYSSLSHGTTYKFSVETFDADGLSAGATTQNRVAKWAVREEYYAVSAPTNWSIETEKVEATDTRAVLQYGVQTSGGAGTDPANWTTDFSSLSSTGATYYWVRYWLFAWNGAATSGVEVTTHSLTYTSSSMVADGWSTGTGVSITSARSWYGTRCLRVDGVSPNTGRWSEITVSGLKVGQTYTLSGRIFYYGDADGRLFFIAGGVGGGTDTITEPSGEFDFVSYTFTATSETGQVYCWMQGLAGTFALFDALKLEEGPVATPWTPSVLSRAIVVDGNGVQVDGRGGGIVRLRGTDTSTTETEVDLTQRGLRFTSPITFKEISAPATPDASHHRMYFKSDGSMYLSDSAAAESVVLPEFIIRADSTRTFTSNTSDQVIFTTPTNGRITLATGTYLIDGMLAFTSMSGTSGNLVFKLLGGGSATLAALLIHTFGQDLAAAGTAAAVGGQWNTTGNSTTNSVTAGAATSLLLRVYGTFEVSSGGTVQPSIAMTNASASVLSIGSHLRFRRIGSTSMTSIGPWD